MIQIINADIFTVKSNLLVHQVNCRGVMGSGIAKVVREKYPQVYTSYIKEVKSSSTMALLGSASLLGYAQIVKITDDFSICNLFGQNYYGRDGKRYTDYEALSRAFEAINQKFSGQTITIPYNLGCGLGGGNWSIVYAIIAETLKDCNVLICKNL